MRRAAFVYGDELTSFVLRDDHPLVPARLRHTYELLESYEAFSLENALLTPPRQATLAEVHSSHADGYVDAVAAFSQGRRLEEAARFGFSETGDNPIFPGMFEACLWSSGASMTAADLLIRGEVDAAANFSGGLHHAMPNRASGFCVFNDPVMAIRALVHAGLRVAYVDIDCHHGDGVQHAFYDSDQVVTISLHESGRYLFPGTGFTEETGSGPGKGYAVNVPLFPYTDDDTYLWAFREVVPPLVQAFRPDVLVTQLGIDTHHMDPITHLQLTVQGYAQLVRELGALSPGRWLALGGGGYHISAVIRGWAMAYGAMLEHDWPDRVPAAVQERYGIAELQDPAPPAIDANLRRDVKRLAEESVAQVHRGVFPAHGLSRPA